MQTEFEMMCMAKVATFGLLLLFFTPSEAQSNCNYYQNLETEETYNINNPNYPDVYNGMNNCKWQIASPYNIKVNCSIEMPRSENCDQDGLSFQFVNGNDIYKYCGNGNFILEGKNVTINFNSPHYTQGGKFSCMLQVDVFDEYNCTCGLKYRSGEVWVSVVGGMETRVNEYPMMAGLVDGVQRELYCGATIISNQYILTAAHCIAGRNISTMGVVVGEHDTSTGNETSSTQLFRMHRCIPHPNYDDIHNDIAVCQIMGTMSYDDGKVGPICLPFERQHDSFNGDYVDLLGWGLKEFGGMKSSTLQGVQVSVTTSYECKNYYGDKITKNHICTSTSGKDSCQMDSGGPLLWTNPTTYNLVLTGIIIGGVGCASPDIPSLNTRVGAYLEWIKSVTPGVQYCQVE